MTLATSQPATLTADERWTITLLGRAFDAFVALPVMHPDDAREFRTLIHHAQEKVMARVAMRVLGAEAVDEGAGVEAALSDVSEAS